MSPRAVTKALTARATRGAFVIHAAVAVTGVWLALMLLSGVGAPTPLLWTLRVVGLALTGTLLVAVIAERAHLRDLVTTDALTGLVNHRGFHQCLRRAIAEAERRHEPLTIVHFDIDNFKQVNDTGGHPYGDDVLRAVGDALRSVVRTDDVAARIGGDEFALILPGSRPPAGQVIAERARLALGHLALDRVELSCSAGIAGFPDDAVDADHLCQLADAALYWAKGAGKGRSRQFDPERVPVPGSQRQLDEVSALLADPDAIVPAFQPVVDLATGRVVGYEALARFPSSPDRSVASWFAAARACGLGAQLQGRAIEAALAAYDRPVGTHLAVNVSPSTLSSKAIRESLPADLDGIVVEITAHEMVASVRAFADAVAELRGRGAIIGIDDTGAGYAGLKQVMRIRPDIVKLDGELTAGIHADAARKALVESFVRFARGIGATVCAEGIQTLEDLATVADLDVAWGQGYALARPSDPWPEPEIVAVDVCRGAFTRALRAPIEVGPDASGGAMPVAPGDPGLERATARLSAARSRADLESAIGLIAVELNADKVALSRWHAASGTVETLAENGQDRGSSTFPVAAYPLTARVLRDQVAVQVLVGDPQSDRSEVELLLALGHRSMLIVPVVRRGESLGIVEAFSDSERAWTRAEINRARIVSNQFASVIEAFFRADDHELASELL